MTPAERTERRADRFVVTVEGEPVLTALDFGTANRAAYDSLPCFRPWETTRWAVLYFKVGIPIETAVWRDGVELARYTLARGRIARPWEPPPKLTPEQEAEQARIQWVFS